MSRYIDADGLKAKAEEMLMFAEEAENEEMAQNAYAIINAANSMQTADVVKVTRCKDCGFVTFDDSAPIPLEILARRKKYLKKKRKLLN